MNTLALDTNAYSLLLKGDNAIQKQVENASRVYMSVIVLGELYAGFKNGTKEKKNIETLEQFLLQPTVVILDVSSVTAQIYADIIFALGKVGKPVPLNDVWIAAQTQETGSVLVTYDTHFLHIPGLRLWDRLSKN